MSKGKVFNIPVVGRVLVATDRFGSATRGVEVDGSSAYETNLTATVIRNGKALTAQEVMPGLNWLDRLRFGKKTTIDLGSGLVTNVGVMALANDWNLAAPSGAAINTFKLAKYHASGTGTTAAAATDIILQTASANGGQTPQAGTQVLVSAANLQKYQTVATIAYTGTEAVTEWGLFLGNALSATTGTPFTATTATSATVTGTPLTASSSTVQGQQQNIVLAGTTTSYGLITSNTTSVLTIPAWYKSTDGTAGSTPGATEAYTLRPVMWDHKVFSAINVVNGDSIQFTYTLTVTSGG